MRRPVLRPLALALALALGVLLRPVSVTAAQGPATEPVDQVRAALSKRFPTLRIEGLRPTPVVGLWEFSVGLEVFYASADGRYVVRGDMVDLASNLNLSDDRRAELRKAQLAKLDAADMIVFEPARPRYTVTVFTDVDCVYCRKLHSQIDQYLALGIRVRYLPWPRAGIGSPSWQVMQDVWCAKDRNAALTLAKRDLPIPHVACTDGAMDRGIRAGEIFRVDGTPLVITQDGYDIGGYLPPADMKRRLDLQAARKPQG